MLKTEINYFLYSLCLCVAVSKFGGFGMADTESVKKRRGLANRFLTRRIIHEGV